MARPLRIEYEGARYHLMNRSDRREAIFLNDEDRFSFLSTLGQACAKTGWQVHAYVLMSNHFHLVVETPQPNLSAGMQWLLGTFTARWNRRRRSWGHLFGGRFKAQLIDERCPGYLRAACDYVHLNPCRAGLVAPMEPLEIYPWSSFPAYLQPERRPCWLRTDRLLGDHGLEADGGEDRQELACRLMVQRLDRQEPSPFPEANMKVPLGEPDFSSRLLQKGVKPHRKAGLVFTRQISDVHRAEQMVQEALRAGGRNEEDLPLLPKGDPWKIAVARRLRAETPMTRSWVAARLCMGSTSYLSALLSVDSKL